MTSCEHRVNLPKVIFHVFSGKKMLYQNIEEDYLATLQGIQMIFK